MVNVYATSVYLMIPPFAIVVSSICEGKPAPAMMLAIRPLSTVNGAIRIVVCAVAIYFVLLPIALEVFLRSSMLGVEGQEESAVAVLHLYPLK